MSLYFIKSDFKKDKDGNYSLGVSKASSIFYRVVDSDEGLEALKAAYNALSEDERSRTVEYTNGRWIVILMRTIVSFAVRLCLRRTTTFVIYVMIVEINNK